MKTFFIISRAQFGYNNATYYYCRYLKADYAIVYIGWDNGLPEIKMDGVRVLYVSRQGRAMVRGLRFMKQALGEIRDKDAIVFIKYFKGVALLLRLLRPGHCFVLDIRSSAIKQNPFARRFSNAQLKLAARFFRHVTVISAGLAKKLNLAHKAHVLPLGADPISPSEKHFDSLHLLYVGTFFLRKIENTIEGFKQFFDRFRHQVSLRYTIIGSGPNQEEAFLRQLAAEMGLQEVVAITGRVPHDQLQPYFDAANIGVAYIPLTDYFDAQPPTKTFEYLASGMPVLATRTSENRKIVNRKTGVLIGESSEDFYRGLLAVYKSRKMYQSAEIRASVADYTWENIVRHNLKPYLDNLIESPGPSPF